MTKQEEIRKGIKTLIAIECSGEEFDGDRLASSILRFEYNMGVVIKVDRELPGNSLPHSIGKYKGLVDLGRQELHDARYVAVAQLI